LYLAGLINETIDLVQPNAIHLNRPYFAAFFTIIVTLYFWRKNIIGMHESSRKALRIMQLTTVMVVMLIIWCLITIFQRGFSPVPFPSLENMQFTDETVGWLKGTFATKITFIAMMIGLGHSVLAMSGEETLGQVNREIQSPKLKNLKRAAFVIFVYSMMFTALVSFFAVMIIPDKERVGFYLDNLIGGLAMNVVGPLPLRLLFHAFVVVVGTIILSGAVNTAIIGSNSVLNRVAEDGVMPQWFRAPHKRFGTTSRIITMVVTLQIVTIMLTRGNITLLGDAYAFGIIWSFTMQGIAVLVLRFKRPDVQEWKVPLNFHIKGREIPLGISLITLALFSLAIINLFTKKVATIWGIGFTASIFLIFQLSEIYNRKRQAGRTDLEKFQLEAQESISLDSITVRPGNVLVTMRNPNELGHLKRVLERVDTRKIDVVALTVRRTSGYGSGGYELDVDQIFSNRIAELFSHVVTIAEKAGKHVDLLVVPGRDYNRATVEVAQRLKSSLVVMGLSTRMTPSQQAKNFGDAWERLSPPRPQLSLEILDEKNNKQTFFNLGPHPPRLWPEDIELLHELWLNLSDKGPGYKLHHRDVIRVALRRLEAELRTPNAKEVLKEVLHEASEEKRPELEIAAELPAEESDALAP